MRISDISTAFRPTGLGYDGLGGDGHIRACEGWTFTEWLRSKDGPLEISYYRAYGLMRFLLPITLPRMPSHPFKAKTR